MLALPSEGKTDQNLSTFNQCLENINFPKIVFFLDKYLNRMWAKSGQQMIIKNRLIQTKKLHYFFCLRQFCTSHSRQRTSHWISLLEPSSQALNSIYSEMKLRPDPLKKKVCWKDVEQTDGRAQLCGFVQLCQSLSLPTQLSKDSPAADFPGMWKCISPKLKFRFVQMKVLGGGGG